ncbi:Lrp/AsnC family transcriptional regulator [Candidatus Woesearchaeota archaeon]|nr:Lrp/AsnC family transcriptional regulator [Candidatus Woesearchaeota archaeon]
MRYTEYKKSKKSEIKLDKKDRTILSILSQNSRLTLSEIAKITNISRDSVNYRINTYQNIGLIQGFRTVVNLKKFNYDNYHLLIQLKKFDEEYIQLLKTIPQIRAIIKYTGKYDLEIALVAKNTEELESLIEKIKTENVQSLEILLLTKDYKTGSMPKSFDNIQIETKDSKLRFKETIDNTDKQLLKLLANNAREKLINLAKELNISADTVNYRIKKLIQQNYIKKFICAINYELINYQTYAVIINMNETKFFENNKNILWAAKTVGKYNTIFYISTKNIKEVHSTMNELKKINNIEYDILIAEEEFKYSYLPNDLNI